MKFYATTVIFLIIYFLYSQTPNPSSWASSLQSYRVINAMKMKSPIKNITATNIGPTIMSGRVVDLSVNPKNSKEFYVAYATGGLWHTVNNGTSFVCLSDNAPTQHIGALAVNWKTNTIWLGTGESNASRSSYSGIGIVKSSNRGKTWEYVGLPDSHHIAKIVLNPNNDKVVWVASSGHLYSKNEERGIFKSDNGGKTWKKTLFINNNTSAIDLVIAPNNSRILYASMWQRNRKAWNFEGAGEESGIYKSTDGGNNFIKISNGKNGFPQNKGIGRIGIALYNENVIYALLDNQNRRKKPNINNKNVLKSEDFENMSIKKFLKLKNSILDNYIKKHDIPTSAVESKNLVKNGVISPVAFSEYLKDGNRLLFDTPVIGAELYKSEDGGNTWEKTHKDYIDDFYYSYGYYFGMIRVSPQDENKIYLGGVPLIYSENGGKSFSSISKENVHADHHALWINPFDENHLISGNDGGVNITYDNGKNWIKANDPAVGQFYTIQVDYKDPYNVYGGLQDNGVWYGKNTYEKSTSWHQNGIYPYKYILGGDGMRIETDSIFKDTVFAGYQFGNYFKINIENDGKTSIKPKHKLGEKPYRFNWQTPILLSKHNFKTFYIGSQFLHVSENYGKDYQYKSDDLTKGGKQGNVPYGTLTSIVESPFKYGNLLVGSDDGLIFKSYDNGKTWQDISKGVPKNMWISEVLWSSHNKNLFYVALNGYRWDNFKTMVYLSQDQGNSWKEISSNLPNSPVNALIEDFKDSNIIYLGNDMGVFVSLNRGNLWYPLGSNIPNIAVHDLAIEKNKNHLLVATHGRSIYKIELSPLQKFAQWNWKEDVKIFEIEPLNYKEKWGDKNWAWDKWNEPNLILPIAVREPGEYRLQVLNDEDKELNSWNTTLDKGLNLIKYDASYLPKKNSLLKPSGKAYLKVGKYLIIVSGKGKSSKTMFEIKKQYRFKMNNN